MNDYLMVFRQDPTASSLAQPSPEKMQSIMKQWQDWMGGIAAQDKLSSSGNRLAAEGKVVKANHVVTDGPYVELKEAVGGYIMVKAGSLQEATDLAKGCPIFDSNGSVEVRTVVPM